MKEYQKIETLYKFDNTAKRFVKEFYNPLVEILKDNKWIFTEKIDGMNFRICWDGHKLSYAGRTDDAVFSADQTKFIDASLEDYPIIFEQMFAEKEVIVFGELFGKNIQGNLGYSPNYQFRVFDVMIGGMYLERRNVEEIAVHLGFSFVPVVLVGTIEDGVNFVRSNAKSTFSEAPLEGVVGKPVGDFYDRKGNRIVVKIKRKDLAKTFDFIG